MVDGGVCGFPQAGAQERAFDKGDKMSTHS